LRAAAQSRNLRALAGRIAPARDKDFTMVTFLVEDMSCSHCVATLRKALTALDPDARLDIDLDAHLVQMESQRADSKSIAAAISAAGYTPQSR
jgi:copper chaperone